MIDTMTTKMNLISSQSTSESAVKDDDIKNKDKNYKMSKTYFFQTNDICRISVQCHQT